ncbi:MAG: transglutaminase-like domain-containing protein [Bacteroidales bacterium]
MESIENIQEIKSLISLLDDPDPEIFSNVEQEIIRRGTIMLPFLEEAGARSDDKLMQDRIRKVVHLIHYTNTRAKLARWVTVGQDNLLLGALIIAKYQYPELKEEHIIRKLGFITQDIYLRIKEHMTPMEKVRIINSVLYDDYEFYGNKRDYQSPQCSYINMVIDTGRGNHLSLGMLYILVARSLGVPIAGVDLQDYFFLGYQEEGKMLFYINPFSRGNTLTQSELLFFLKLAEVDVQKDRIEAASNLDIIRRLIITLAEAYQKLGKPDKAQELNGLLEETNL